MQVAKVIGNIWATRKEEKLSGLKLLLVKPLDVLEDVYKSQMSPGPAKKRSVAAW